MGQNWRPIPLREKHAQCVKKSGFFIRFLSARNDRFLFFREFPQSQPCLARGVTASLPWHELSCQEKLTQKLLGVKNYRGWTKMVE
jgi:hypothetical protein